MAVKAKEIPECCGKCKDFARMDVKGGFDPMKAKSLYGKCGDEDYLDRPRHYYSKCLKTKPPRTPQQAEPTKKGLSDSVVQETQEEQVLL